MDTILALVEELLAELGDEGQQFAQVDREKLYTDIERNLDPGSVSGSGSGRFLALLARDESDTPIGVLTLSTSFALYAGGEYGVIDEMYVRPEHRSRGVGRALVERAVAVARDKGWYRLDVTAPENESGERALRFYQELGFSFTGPKLRLLVGS